MLGIAFKWDPKKETSNRKKHDVSFAEASTVFSDPLSITIGEPEHSLREERFAIVGASALGRLIVVIHTVRGDRIRLISARGATKNERRNYEETSL